MDAAASAYYTSRIREHTSCASSTSSAPGIEVSFADASRGKILRATRDYEEGEVIWSEEALVGMLHLPSARLLGGCAHCGRPIRSLAEEWSRCSSLLLADESKRLKKLSAAAAKKGGGKKVKPMTKEEAAVSQAAADAEVRLPELFPLSIDSSSIDETSSSSASSHPAATSSSSPSSSILSSLECIPVPCSGCSSAAYCSSSCRSISWSTSHALLCGAAALEKFAAAQNEAFWLAAKAVAQMTLGALKEAREDWKLQASFQEAKLDASDDLRLFALQLHSHLLTLSPDSAAALRAVLSHHVSSVLYPYLQFCGSVWSDHVSLPLSVDAEEEAAEEEYRQTLVGTVEQALQKMQEQVEGRINATATATAPPVSLDTLLDSLHLSPLFTLSTFQRLLSSFELNCIGLHAPTAAGVLVRHVEGVEDEKEKAKLIDQIGSDTYPALRRRVSALGDSVEGTGLFAIGCCMNHSCAPSVTLLQTSDPLPADAHSSVRALPILARLDRSAVFIALRRIEQGEELNISYIDLLQATSAPAAGDASFSGASAEDLEEVGFAQRQELLKAYQFECACAKCAEQR